MENHTHTHNAAKRLERLSLAQNYLLIWLDSNFDESNEDFSHSLEQLKRIVNTINVYNDVNQCFEFIYKAKNENILMIISGALGQQIISDIHSISEIKSIYIFCNDRTKHEQWIQPWTKIEGAFSSIESICEQLKIDSRQCERDSTSIQIINTNCSNQLEATFVYTNLFKDIIFEMNYEKNDFDNLVQQCQSKYQDNTYELEIINEFENNYKEHRPIWWYTRECFMYHILNRTLRTFDVDMILTLGPFIQDLHQHLCELHSQQKHSFQPTFMVYRGQRLLKTHFNQIEQSFGGLLSFNNFLSTSIDRLVSLGFAQNCLDKDDDHIGVLFQMNIDSSIDKSPFALLNDESYFDNTEQEILFSMNSVFRIGSIEQIPNSQIYQIQLSLTTSDVDQQMQALYQRTQQEIQGSTPRHCLGHLLIKLDYGDKSEQIYKSLLANTSPNNHQEYSYLKHMLGYSYCNQGKYQEAIESFQDAIQIIEHFPPDQRILLGTVYSYLGETYSSMGEHLEALKYYGKSLEIRKDCLPDDHLDLADSYIDLGNMHRTLGEFPKALQHYIKALEIRQKSLPAIHVNIAVVLNNLGRSYLDINDFHKSEEYFLKSQEVYKKCFPPLHQSLIMINNNLGIFYQTIGEDIKAIQYFENILKIKENHLSANDLKLATDYENIAAIYFNIGNHQKAIESYIKSLNIMQISLPDNHPDLARIHRTLGCTYYRIGQTNKALEYLLKSMDIYQNLDSSKYPEDLSLIYADISNIYRDSGEKSKSIEFSEKVIEIQQMFLTPNHDKLLQNYSIIANDYNQLKQYANALEYLQKVNNILIRKSLPTNNPVLAQNYYDMATVYYQMIDYDQALIFYQKSIEIQETVYPQDKCQLIMLYKNMFNLHECTGEYSKAIEIGNKLIELVKQSQSESNEMYSQLAEMYYRLKDYPTALKSFTNLLQIAENTLPYCYAHLLTFNSRIAEIYFLLGQPNQAEQSFAKCQDILQVCPNLNQMVESALYLGDLYYANHNYQIALEYFQRAFQFETQTNHEKTDQLGKIYSQIGNLQQLTHDYGNALISLQNAMNIQRNIICSRIDLAWTYNYLGETHRKLNNYPQAFEFYEKALKIREKLSYYYHPDLAEIYRNLAEYYYDIRQMNLAYEFIQKAIDIIRNTLSQSHPIFSTYLQTLNKIQQYLL